MLLPYLVKCVQEIKMLKNCVNKLLWKTETTMQDSATEKSKKYSFNNVSII